MACLDCTNINDLPRCASTWSVGEVSASYDTDELIWLLRDLSTGRLFSGVTEPVSSGEVTITIPDELTALMDHQYELSLYEDETLAQVITVTIGLASACCIRFNTLDYSLDAVIFSTNTCA